MTPKQLFTMFMTLTIVLILITMGIVAMVQYVATPDSIKTVEYIQRNNVTVDQSESARQLAEANKAEAEARAVTSKSFIDSTINMLFLVACAIVVMVVIFGLFKVAGIK